MTYKGLFQSKPSYDLPYCKGCFQTSLAQVSLTVYRLYALACEEASRGLAWFFKAYHECSETYVEVVSLSEF